MAKMRKEKKWGKILGSLAAVLVLVILGICILCFSCKQVTVGNETYTIKKGKIDLREKEISRSQVDALQTAAPDCEILWNVPFQRRSYESTAEKITVTDLTPEDVEMLTYLKRLKKVDASNCFDYEALAQLKKTLPQCEVEYSVAMEGEILPWNTEKIELSQGQGSFKDLMRKLPCLPELKELSFREPKMTGEELKALEESFPQIHFSWTKELFGKQMDSEVKNLDISGMKFESIREVEEQTAFLPNLQQLIMCDTGLPYDDIADFRERSRNQFQVVFNVIIKDLDVRTDITRFVPYELGSAVSDCDTRHLVYCEDLIYVDLSHCVVRNIDWARGTPHLRYLIIKDSPFRDIQPLRSLKELKLLELSNVDLRDMRPLADCTGLEDLKVTGAYPNIPVISQMEWLRNLWVSGDRGELTDLLPDTAVHGAFEAGWEELPNYREMKELTDPNVPQVLENPPKRDIIPGFVIPKM